MITLRHKVLVLIMTLLPIATPARAQDESTILPVDAVNATEILNEAGAAQSLNFADSEQQIFESSTVLAQIEITVPSSGFVLAMASGTLSAHHSNGQTDHAVIGVIKESTVGCLVDLTGRLDDDQRNRIFVPASALTGEYAFPFSAQKIFPVESGTNKFCVGAELIGSGAVFGGQITLSLIFVPTAYGLVES